MEESLFTQKQIRQYFKCYSDAHHNRVARATMMLGIQELMRQNSRALQGDFSYLSPDDLEELVIENELKLYQKMRQLKMRRSKSRETSAEKASTAPEPKRVTIMEQAPVANEEGNQDEDMNSVVPQLSIPPQSLAEEIEMDKGPAAAKTSNSKNSNNLSEKTQTDTPEQSKDLIDVSNVKPRFQRDYSRQKSSTLMKTLLEADAVLIKKRDQVVSGSQITSKIAFEKKRNQESRSARDPQGILAGNRSQKSIQPSQKPRRESLEANTLDRANSNDGVRSRSRASSRWRRGVTQDSLERQAQESARLLEEKKQIGMVYPSWWQLDEEDSPKKVSYAGQGAADPVRAKVHKKNLGRYAEDSLDARLRQIRDGEEAGSIEVDYANQHMNTVNLKNNRAAFFNQDGEQYQAAMVVRQQSDPQMSSQQQINPQQHVQTPNQMSSTSSKKVNMLNTTNNVQSVGRLNKTNGTQASLSSFAYTSNKAVPKYSPARAPRDGASNIPMSYSGPPTKQEMNRNYMRHMSGNRNFNGEKEEQQQVSEPRLLNAKGQPQNSFKRAAKAKKEKRSQRKQEQSLIEEGHKNYISMQREAQKNRARNQIEVEGDDQFRNRDKYQYTNEPNTQSQVQDESLSMQRFAKGGVAMTIACLPAEQRNESGSPPRNPYNGAEPFQQAQQENRQFVDNPRNYVQRPETAKRVPKQYLGVQSTIRDRVEQDKRMHQSRQNEGSPQVRIYEPKTNNDSQVEPEDSSYTQGVQAQIFYKKNDSKVIYAEGQDSYRPPPQYQYSEQEVHQYNNTQAEAASSAAQVPSLRRRAVSPQTQAAISSQQRSRQQAPPQQAYYNVRSSHDTHNETGFTNKLMAQNYSNQPQSLYVPQSNQISSAHASSQQQSSYVDQRNDYRQGGPGQQMYQHYFNPEQQQVQATGPSSQYAEYNYKNMPGQILVSQNQKNPDEQYYYEQESSSAAENAEGLGDTQGQVRQDDLQYTDERKNLQSSNGGDKNNTSRFAFSNEQKGEQQTESQYDNGQHFYQNQSNFDQNNYSHGGSKAQLQNQLEQVLMMKSGEFSAGGRGQENGHLRSAGSLGPIDNEDVGFGPDRGRQQYQPSGGNQLVSEYGRRSQERLQQQNYGNPNFVPPQNYGEEGGAFRNYQSEIQNNGYQQKYGQQQPIYKTQYPATYQQYEQQSSQKNFNTSQFAGNQAPPQQDPEGMHQKQNSRTQFAGMPFGNNNERNQNGNNFTLSRPSAQNFGQEEQFQGSYKNMRHEANLRRDPNGYTPVYQSMPPQVRGEMQMQPPSVGPGSYRISSGRNRRSNEEEKQPAKYYQTFNEDESSSFIQQQNQQQQQPESREQNTISRRGGMDSEELSEYSENKILGKNNNIDGRGEDDEVHEGGMESSAFGEDDAPQDTSQLSPTQTTPGKYADERRGGGQHTENLRNFMETAQPGLGVLESQNITPSQQAPSGSANGVRKIQNYSQNNYAGLANQAVDFTNEESSPDISDTNNLSPSPPKKGGQVQALGEDDFSSLQETPDSPQKQGLAGENLINRNLEKISSHALQLSNHLQQMNDQLGHSSGAGVAQAQSSLSDTKNLNEASSPEGQDAYNDAHVQSRGKQMASESLSDLNDSQL